MRDSNQGRKNRRARLCLGLHRARRLGGEALLRHQGVETVTPDSRPAAGQEMLECSRNSLRLRCPSWSRSMGMDGRHRA